MHIPIQISTDAPNVDYPRLFLTYTSIQTNTSRDAEI